MALAILAIVFCIYLFFGYWSYGGWVAKQFNLRADVKTPAHLYQDGEDFIPTRPFYLFGQHFSAIAAAGPIAGPILAGQVFGWGPSLIWIALGVVFIGAVHDFSSLAASVKNGACSVADITKINIGKRAGILLMFFIWISLIYIIVAFGDITAASFTSVIEEIQGVKINFNPGGAVAASSVFYLLLALVMGVILKIKPLKDWQTSLIFVPLAFVTTFLGTQVSELFIFPKETWSILIVIYCGIASILPVWLLLQPRGFLGGYILYFAIGSGVIGILFGGYEIQQPFFIGWESSSGSTLFPFLFVTIACGACSGFHGLVCSGTTSKQLDRETHAHSIGYGAMCAEAFVAFIALAILMIASPSEILGVQPGTIYGNGIGKFIALVIGEEHLPLAITFGAMAFSTFVFDTIDVATRLGRYLIQELTGMKGHTGSLLGTLGTILPAGYFLLSSEQVGWRKFWAIFGASNQLLAALTLLAITLWLARQRKNYLFTLIPMVFVLVMTVWALISLALDVLKLETFNFMQASPSIVAFVLLVLAFLIGKDAFVELKKQAIVKNSP